MSFECNKCGKAFSSKFNLERHLSKLKPCDIQEADEEKENQCPHCNKLFSRKDALKRHISSCADNPDNEKKPKKKQELKPKECYYCNKPFTRHESMIRHLESCKENPENETKLSKSNLINKKNQLMVQLTSIDGELQNKKREVEMSGHTKTSRATIANLEATRLELNKEINAIKKQLKK